MQDRYKDDVLTYISKNGASGVNSISKGIDVPLSTLQKYLHRQSYFRINEDKKWDLPENVVSDIKTNTLELMTNVLENSILLLKSQLEETLHSVQNTIEPLNSLKRGIITQSRAVAESGQVGNSNIDERLVTVSNNSDILTNIFKKQKDKIPEEYMSIIFGFDYVGLVLKEGENYTKEFLEDGLYGLLSGKDSELSEDTIDILKANQK